MRTNKGLRGFWNKLQETARKFKEIDPLTEASSLAFTTIFAIPAVIIITLTVASFFYDTKVVQDALYTQAGGFIGERTSEDLKAMVSEAGKTQSGLFPRIMGVVALIASATAAFAALQSSLNKIWRVEPEPGRAIMRYLVSRLTSLALIASFGFLLLMSLVLDAALVAVVDRVGGAHAEETWLAALGGFLLSFGVVMLVFAVVFKFLPDVRIQWRSVWVGAFFTAVLFSVGKFLIGLYISRTGAADTYGAGGAIIIIMLWVYYSAIILLYGAQYTQVSARLRGERIEPVAHARKLAAA